MIHDKKYKVVYIKYGRGGSSVSVVSDYRLDYRGSIPGRDKEFFL
jgi:hypothetical protein